MHSGGGVLLQMRGGGDDMMVRLVVATIGLEAEFDEFEFELLKNSCGCGVCGLDNCCCSSGCCC